MSRELLIHTHFSGEVGHIEIFAPALDQAILVKLIDGDHLMGAGLAKNDRCIGALLHHHPIRSEEHTSELQSLMRISYAVFCLKKKNTITYSINTKNTDQ